MWRTECGERIREGAEAFVFAETLSSLLDDAIMGQFDDYELGIVCFDNLTYGQKIPECQNPRAKMPRRSR